MGHGRGLTIRGTSESTREDQTVIQQERGIVEYVRQVPTGVEMLANEAKASFEDGILTVTVPKAEPTSGSQTIEVK